MNVTSPPGRWAGRLRGVSLRPEGWLPWLAILGFGAYVVTWLGRRKFYAALGVTSDLVASTTEQTRGRASLDATALDRIWGHASKISLATLITALGLIFYGLKANDYELFYHRLSVDPNDVGLSYATVLTRSRQQIITPLVLVAMAICANRQFRQSEAVAEWRTGRAHSGRWLRIRQGRIWMAAAVWLLASIMSTLAFLTYCITIYLADSSIKVSADTVISGEAIIRGVRTPGAPWTPSGLSVLNVQVRRAWIEPVEAGSIPPGLKGLTGPDRPLLYLGQSDGTIVLYDPSGVQVVYVPRSSVVLNVEVLV